MPAADSSVLLIDGATGTELDRAGVDISLPLWSARAIEDAPDVLGSIHEAYLASGAQAITTNTFRTSRRALTKGGWDDRAAEVTRRAVEIARDARDAVRRDALVLGAVAPIEDCYRPELAPSAEVCESEHAEMIGHLLEAGVDVVLIETIGTAHEAAAAARAARRLAPGRWMLSVCLRDDTAPGTLLSGEPFSTLGGELHDALAVGVNCTSAPNAVEHVRVLRAALSDEIPVAAYANVGAADTDGSWIITDAVAPDRFAEYALDWIDAGASIIGGCCGTTPATIAAIADAVRERGLALRHTIR